MLNSTGIDDVNAKQPSIRRVLHCFDKNIRMAIGVIKEEVGETSRASDSVAGDKSIHNKLVLKNAKRILRMARRL